MKFALKSIVAAAAFIAVGAASAANVTAPADGVTVTNGFTVKGSGTLNYSQDLIDAYNVGGVVASAWNGATSSIVGAPGGYTAIAVTAGLTSVTYDGTSGQVGEVVSVGGVKSVASKVSGVSNGGYANVGNLDVRFQTDGSAWIYGDIIGQSDAGVAVNQTGIKLFTVAAANITGDKSFNGAGTYNTTLTNLALDSTAFNYLSTALALQSLGKASLQYASGNFGTLTSTITVTAAIPEPSTYALMGAGLLGVALARRRSMK